MTVEIQAGRGADTVLIDEIEDTEARVHHAARAAMGVVGDERTEPFWRSLRKYRVSLYPLIILGLLIIIDRFQLTAYVVMAPEIGRALGVGRGVIAALIIFQGLALTLTTLPMAALVERRPIRGIVASSTAMVWSVLTVFTGFVTNLGLLTGIFLADGATSASTDAVHQPLLMDSYPTGVRARVLSGYWISARGLGAILPPLYVALLTGVFDFTWRGVFLVMGLTCVAVSLTSVRLRDPGFGRWDTSRVRETVHGAGHAPAENDAADYELRFFEIMRRLLAIPTVRRILVSTAVLGMLLAPLNAFLSFQLDEKYGLDPTARGYFFAALPVFGIVSTLLLAGRFERLFRRDPALLLKLCAAMQLGSGALIVVALLMPTVWGLTLFLGLSVALTAALLPGQYTAYLSIVRPQMRPHATALLGIFQTGVGGIAGLLLISGIDSRYGVVAALVSVVAIFGTVSAGVLYSASRLINTDLDRLVGELVEEEELRGMSRRGVQLPMLACRKVDFSYGQLQVLFGVDFTVDDGEMVALLGTNGAGKSTLLRVVSGLGYPSRGSVRFRGGDITFLEPPRRVRLGITQVPGGRSVFGPLSVVENLRTFGYSRRRNRREVERAIEVSFDAFPALAARRNQPASTLSGGEQQMLGLSKALILQPRLLLIDELSLGLAPKIVAELLVMVRRINHSGSAVVLVEQSVNVALSVARHAYFMEKGEIRFDGASDDLLARPDLLRSVFLEGAAKGLGHAGMAMPGVNGMEQSPTGARA